LQAAWNCNLRVLEGLVEQAKAAGGRGVASAGDSGPGYGPAHFAAALGNLEVLELLLSNGIDKNERDADGNSPLIWVVSSDGPDELLESLVDHGASINLKNFVGESALSLACQRGLARKAEYLLENGADPNAPNLDGATPLHHAAALGDVALIALLVRWGAHVNSVDDEGDSPLHWAVREDKPEAAQRLIEMGADVSLANEDGENPIELVLACGDQAFADRLVVFAGNKPAAHSSFAAEPAAADVEMHDEMARGLKTLSVHELRTVSFGGGLLASNVVIY
jgi:ankyrin repeat protein